jgi:uncharacterized membrane protein YdcZ (DUF606 family)
MKTAGIILIVIGIFMVLIRGVWVPVEKNIVDVGPLKIDKKENKWIGWPTYTGAILVMAGAVFMFSNKKP